MGRIARFVRKYYAPFLLKPVVKGIVLIVFAGVFVLSIISIQHIQLGLGMFVSSNSLVTHSLSRPATGITLRILPGSLLR